MCFELRKIYETSPDNTDVGQHPEVYANRDNIRTLLTTILLLSNTKRPSNAYRNRTSDINELRNWGHIVLK